MWLPIVFLALTSMLSLPARAGQVHEEEQALSAAQQQATLVVTVKLDTPASTAVQIPTSLPKGYDSDGTLRLKPAKPCGPYAYAAYSGVVDKVLEPTVHAPVAAGERIVIFPANTGALLDLTRMACADGGSKSPIFPRLKGGAEPKDGATLTVLLRWEETIGWVEVMAGAWLAAPPPPFAGKPRPTSSWRKGDDALCVKDEDCVVVVAPRFDKDGALDCGVCPPCELGADTPMARAAARRHEAMCVGERARRGVVATCERCAPTQKKAVCQAMRCVMKR